MPQELLVASQVALWVVVLLQLILLLGLAREMGVIRVRLGPQGALMSDVGLEIGDPAPDFETLEIPSNRTVPFRAEGVRQTLLVFVSPDCTPCKHLLKSMDPVWEGWQRTTRVTVVCEGNDAQVRGVFGKLGLRMSMFTDPLSKIRELYGQPPTPFAYLIGSDGTVLLKGIVNERDDVERLIEGRARIYGGREVVA